MNRTHAYALVDKHGFSAVLGMAVAFCHNSNKCVKSNKRDLLDTLRENNCTEIVETGWNKLRVVPEKVDCDYYDWYDGKPNAISTFFLSACLIGNCAPHKA